MPYKKIFISLLLTCAAVIVAAVALSERIFLRSDITEAKEEVSAEKTPLPTVFTEDIKISYGDIIELQKRLIELNYLTYDDFSGEYDASTFLAVMLFQEHNTLLKNGLLDENTKKILFADNAQTREEKEFAILAPTVNMEFSELVGDNGIYDYPAGYPKEDTYKIIVDVAHQVVMIYKKDIHGEYTVPVRYMICSTGARGHTPTGTFKMKAYRVRFGKFVNDGVYGQYWSQIYKAFYFHTILYSKKDASTYTVSSYKNLGKAVSHGCVRLTVPDARWIWYNIAPGTVCEIRKGDKKDAQTAAIRKKLVLAKAPSKRPSLKMGEIPYTDNWRVEDVPLEIPFVQGSQD